MTNKKNQKRKDALNKKSAVETLRFQTHWGLKQLGQENGNALHKLADEEIESIAELDLVQDLLAVKAFIDGVKQSLSAFPMPEMGDFAKALLLLHLAFQRSTDLNQ